jgi:hypothetical protein
MLTGARGFLLAKGVNGRFTPIDFPGARRTQVGGLNDQGTIVGRYENSASRETRAGASAQRLRRPAQPPAVQRDAGDAGRDDHGATNPLTPTG